jgi:hypothetical protein
MGEAERCATGIIYNRGPSGKLVAVGETAVRRSRYVPSTSAHSMHASAQEVAK